ncbi:tRNA (adenine-N(1)-)-methyltransferase catalytic subunit trm61 [Toensbergia leucococca]|nr:tRNA (adenine-N(1)-)-methyltransferase catalytic subunit trm61 [Toensbergia leucococca]
MTIQPVPPPPHPSSFLNPGTVAQPDSLALLHLKRDHLIPTLLRAHDDLNEGYDEGKVTNTRFGSFPHSTLIGLPWGSQVRASAIDTGSRGRRGFTGKDKKGHKRKREGEAPAGGTHGQKWNKEAEVLDGQVHQGTDPSADDLAIKAAVTASSGFVHLLPPTPETWTASLPHRTQLVYTPDYSYILYRLRVRPGSVLIEAGAGSGSFTHAAARAVFSGYPTVGTNTKKPYGKVWSFEFHKQRVETLKAEIDEHGLGGVVEVTHRDVCQEGFYTDESNSPETAINADAIFLDLPAPWLALKHLTRDSDHDIVEQGTPDTTQPGAVTSNDTQEITNGGRPQIHDDTSPSNENTSAKDSIPLQPSKHTSPLSPTSAIHLCTFSPCIEQVQRTIQHLRTQNWHSISMVELSSKRLEVRRERVGLQEEGLRNVNASPATVSEALARLREIEGRNRTFRTDSPPPEADEMPPTPIPTITKTPYISKQQRLSAIRTALPSRKLYKEGRLIHRAEPELKTHTSYLVFAILPRAWSAADEEAAQQRWPSNVTAAVPEKGEVGMSRRQMKREAKVKAGGNKAVEMEGEGV